MWQLLPKAQLGLLVIVAMVLVLMAMALMAMALVPRGQDCDSCEQQRAKRWEGIDPGDGSGVLHWLWLWCWCG